MEFTLDGFLNYIKNKGISDGFGLISYHLGEHYNVTYSRFYKGVLWLTKDGTVVKTVDLGSKEEKVKFENELFSHDNIYDLIDFYYSKLFAKEEKIEKYFEK